MATFLPVVRGVRRNGLMAVYVRISHDSKTAYLRTGKFVGTRGVSSRGEIKDSYVNRFCYDLIERCGEALNEVEYKGWSVVEIRDFLSERLIKGVMTFSGFCKDFIGRKRKLSEGNAHVYEASLVSLSNHLGCEDVRFGDLSAALLTRWIDSLEGKVRARSLYPKCVKTMWEAAALASRDGRNGIEELSRNVWEGVVIPRYVSERKRAVSAQACRAFFGYEPKGEGHGYWLMELGRDVAMLVFCLAGMNTVDLYDLRKKDLYDGIVHYRRRKTSGRRSDGAYFEMRVPTVLEPVIERWRASEESDRLFRFAELYRDAKNFNTSVNNGVKRICAELETEEMYSAYTFRHTWATLAQNDVGAHISDIALGMNHATNSVTRGYIKMDFSPAWRLNEAVVGLVFGDGAEEAAGDGAGEAVSGRNGETGSGPRVVEGMRPHFVRTTMTGVRDGEEALEVSPKRMIYARVYFRGEMVAETGDIGFSSVGEVVSRLAGKLGDAVPTGGSLLFRIKDVDADREAVFERTRGKDF